MHRLLHDTRRSLASPSRNPRMATVLGRLLGAAFLITFITGLYSHVIQEPLPWMRFPTRPVWIYQVSQGIHITAGIACFPLLFAKLYAVFPELFQSPPIRGVVHLLERLSILLFVAASLVEITIGLLNTFQLYALFPFPFRQTHFALSFVVIGSLALHIGIKLSTISAYWRKKDSYAADGSLILHGEHADAAAAAPPLPAAAAPPLPTAGGSSTTQAPTGVTGRIFAWIDATPDITATPRLQRASRRGFLVTVGLAVATVVGLTAGQSFRALDGANLFAPRKRGIGPNALPINRTARAAKVLDTATSPDWTLTVTGAGGVMVYTLADLQALPQTDVRLPIACVEGWSQYADWRGVRIRDLADASGMDVGSVIRATSLEQKSIYATSELGPEFVRDELTLVALEVNGAPLDIDHGYPARLIAPARPGVLQTKWLTTLEEI